MMRGSTRLPTAQRQPSAMSRASGDACVGRGASAVGCSLSAERPETQKSTAEIAKGAHGQIA